KECWQQSFHHASTPKMRLEETPALTPALYRPERGAPAPRDSDAPVTRRAGALRSDGGSAHSDRAFPCSLAWHRLLATNVSSCFFYLAFCFSTQAASDTGPLQIG